MFQQRDERSARRRIHGRPADVRAGRRRPPRVSVSYAACSDRVCYPPVKNTIVGLG
jgi:hypothetical protein